MSFKKTLKTSLKAIMVVSFFITSFITACSDDSTPRRLDPEIKRLIIEASELQDSIVDGRLFRKSTSRDKENLRSLITDIKHNLIRINQNPNNEKSYRLIIGYIQLIKRYQLQKQDAPAINQFIQGVSRLVEKKASQAKLKLGDFTYPLYTTNFSGELAPFASFADKANWQVDISLDENTYVAVNGQGTDSWLLSPTFDLSNIGNPSFVIEHLTMVNANRSAVFDRAEIMDTVFKAYVSTNYQSGDPKAAGVTWEPVDLGAMPNSREFHTIRSKEVKLDRFKGKTVTIAFRFNMDANKLGYHYLTWQISRFELLGSGDLAPYVTRARTVYEHAFTQRQLEPFQVFQPLDGSSWVTDGRNGRVEWVKVSADGKPTESWLLSPRYKVLNQEQLQLIVEETFKNPDWDNISILISTKYESGDPRDAEWMTIENAQPVEPDAWAALITGPIDLEPYIGNEDFVLAFRFTDPGTPRGPVWEILSIKILGFGEDLTFESIPSDNQAFQLFPEAQAQ